MSVLKIKGLETADVLSRLAQVMTADTGMKVHLAHASLKADKLKWVHYGLADMVDGGDMDFRQMLEGDKLYRNREAGAFPVRLVWVLSKYDSGFIVRGDSYIKDVYDIKPGVRVVDMSYFASQKVVEGLLRWAGINDLEKDVRWVKATSTEHKAQLIATGEADVAFAVPTGPITEKAEKNPHGLRWINLNADKDPDGEKRFREKSPVYPEYFAPMFRGVPSCHGVWGLVGADQFCCRADADTGLIYHLVKWLDENYPKFKDAHPWLEQMTRQNLMEKLDHTFLPAHEGLMEYLKELKLWTDAHEKRQARNAELVGQWCEARQKAMWLADEKGIVVSGENPEWGSLWEDYKKELNLPVFDLLPSLHKA
ncbi:MAG: hypothetical protein C4555_03395 [Dehalococcoidia bacterium]|nr:MAG: hypothetical protein C4555_03395 [Dehalococcoidia bacterium]